MSFKSNFLAVSYQNLLKPIAFSMDAEYIHNRITDLGEGLENYPALVSGLFSYKSPSLKRTVLGIEFENPIGLAAGFDYDGHLARVLKYVGFGFNTVGTVTAIPYEGNARPRLARLVKSKSLLVNKGFKSEGAAAVAKRLDKKGLKNHTVGISVGSSNVPQIDTTTKAIDDYLLTFDVFAKRKYVKYFELNISCPNTLLPQPFTDPNNFKKLIRAVSSKKLHQPIFVKMPNEIRPKASDELISIALKKGVRGFIFSNLVKNRNNPAFDSNEIKTVAGLRGNFSGLPTAKNALSLIKHARKKYGREIALVGCGGIFTPQDATEKLDAGADLLQLITGIIFMGPQLIGQICENLAE